MSLSSDDRGLSEALAVAISAAVGLGSALLITWLMTTRFNLFYEIMFRIDPTIQGGGIGSDWVQGNTEPLLNLLISLTHAADVIMGLFILMIVFVHWAIFRRLGARMRQPGTDRRANETVATDGSGGDRGGEVE